jgi:hypothetical protein
MTTDATAGRVTALRRAISEQCWRSSVPVPPIAALSFGGMGCGRSASKTPTIDMLDD